MYDLRDLFIVWNSGREVNGFPAGGFPVRERLRKLVPLMFFQPGWSGLKDSHYELFDWSRRRLSHDVCVGEVPKPGVVILVLRHTTIETDALANQKYLEDAQAAWAGAKISGLVNRHLESDAAEFEPEPVFKFDVFLSYAGKDAAVAAELKSGMEAQGLRCFLAKTDLKPGQVWGEAIRESLQSSRALVLLLTPNSVRSKWVMAEAGAAWVLGRPLIPAFQFVRMNSIPEFIRAHQAMPIDTIEQRGALVSALKQLKNGLRPSDS
jgi:hypothetical protein